jgi:hypothetical protein
MSATVQWRGVPQMQANCGVYAGKVVQAVTAVLEHFQPIFEQYSKTNATWTDRTGNARQGLYTDVQELARDVVGLFLAHGMQYGIFLESRFSGRYQILWPTIQAHLQQISNMLRGIFG